MEGILGQLKASFGEGSVTSRALPDGRTTFKVVGVPLPPDCTPPATDVWVVFSAQNRAPEVYVRQGIKVKGSISPRNTYPETIEGEPVMRFSTNLSYDPNKPLASYIYAKLGRFSRAE